MKRSLNEIEGEFRKAFKGAGFPVGLAEDGAVAGALLVRHGQDGAGAILAAIGKGYQSRPVATAALTGSRFEEVNCAVVGPSVLDFAASQPETTVTIGTLDQPLFFAGLAIGAARQYAMDFTIRFDEGCEVRTRPDQLVIEGELPTGPCGARISSRQAEPAGSGQSNLSPGFEVNEEAWQDVRVLSARTCVPASEASRMLGAGAQINDND